MLNKILFAFLIVFGMVGYAYYTNAENKIVVLQTKNLELQNVIQAQELREVEQEKTINALQENMQRTTEALKEQTKRNAEIEEEAQRYLAIFARHNLAKLAAAKPGLIEPKFNKGTRDVFKSIEEDSAAIDSIDD
jgi:predicted nucleotide-binding protein (sugar kinase/HSP70/actin superfamily)